MKSFFVPITLIIGLIVLFAIIDRKEFIHHDNALTETKVSISRRNTASSTSVNREATSEHNDNGTSESNEAEIKKKSITPTAIPVLTPEQAEELSKEMKREADNEKKRGSVFFRELFLTTRIVEEKVNDPLYKYIYQTKNWKVVQKEINPGCVPRAMMIENVFSVTSTDPLEYYFDHPLYEHSMYKYSLACIAKGNGKITISAKETNVKKEYTIESVTPKTITQALGEADTFSVNIKPIIQFQGNLQIESVTLYQQLKQTDYSVCLGTIEDISNVPDINKSNYPDCYYTAKLNVKQILDGKSLPQDIQLLIPAFLNNEIDPLSEIMKKGDWKLAIRPFSSATKDEQEIEQVDEIDTFEYAPFILVNAKKSTIPELHISAIPILEGRKYISPYDIPANLPLEEKYISESAQFIQSELTKINQILESIDDSEDNINSRFSASWEQTQKQYDELDSTVIWANNHNSFFALPKKWDFIHPQKISEQNLESIKELDRFFKSQGTLFIIQIIPDYQDIAALILNPEFQKYGDQQSAVVAKQLLENGIETQYLSDTVVQDAFKYERLFFYPYDYHPDQGMTDIMTSRATKRMESFGVFFEKDYKEDLFSREYYDTGFGSKLKWPANVSIGSHEAGTNVKTPYIFYNKRRILSNPDSKILVIGNSFIQEPYERDAYVSFLTSKMLCNIQGCAMSGISVLTALPTLLLLDYQKYLKDKKVVILPISISFLTDKQGTFTNINHIDKLLKQKSNESFYCSIPLKTDSIPSYPSSFLFGEGNFQSYISNHTGLVILSRERPTITIKIPPKSNINHLSISLQPAFRVDATILVNETPYKLASSYLPNWQNIIVNTNDEMSQITIKLDLENSSNNPFVFIGNISCYN